ncbi:hypothetical protein DAI22_04g085550 [Oryza sativa Japonica Group]|nr:hypothetical protein DAI22_04g085550 [Oryza sativa Japonica Group]
MATTAVEEIHVIATVSPLHPTECRPLAFPSVARAQPMEEQLVWLMKEVSGLELRRCRPRASSLSPQLVPEPVRGRTTDPPYHSSLLLLDQKKPQKPKSPRPPLPLPLRRRRRRHHHHRLRPSPPLLIPPASSTSASCLHLHIALEPTPAAAPAKP